MERKPPNRAGGGASTPLICVCGQYWPRCAHPLKHGPEQTLTHPLPTGALGGTGGSPRPPRWGRGSTWGTCGWQGLLAGRLDRHGPDRNQHL